MTEVETMMLEAAKRIDNGDKSNSKIRKEIQETSDTKTLYLHWQYHPCDITKNAIRKAYNKTLMGIDGFDKMTICFSRLQNMRDLLTNSMLNDMGMEKMSLIIDSSKEEH
jgi:hypothetical protein